MAVNHSSAKTKGTDHCSNESWMRIMAYGGQGSADNLGSGCDSNDKICLPRMTANKPNDSIGTVPLRLWWKWDRVRSVPKKHDSFLARFCINMKYDYTPGREYYLKNSYGIVRGSKGKPRKIHGATKLNKMFKNVANMYKDPKNTKSMFLSYRVVADYKKCTFKMDVYTGFSAGRKKAHRYHGDPKLGGSVLVFDTARLEPVTPGTSTNLYVFKSLWDRSILTDKYTEAVSKSQLAWIYTALGATVSIENMQWSNWDIQRKVELRLSFDPQKANMYSIDVWRRYRVFRHRKVPGEVRDNYLPVGQWTELGTYMHNHQKLYVIDPAEGRNSTEGNGEIAKQVRQSETANLRRFCPWVLRSPQRMNRAFNRFEADQRRGKFNIPGTKFTRIGSNARPNNLIKTKAKGCLYQNRKYLKPRARGRLASSRSNCTGQNKLTFEFVPTPPYTFLKNGSKVRFKTRYGQYLWVSSNGRVVKQKPLLIPTPGTTFTLKVLHNGRLENNAKIALKCHNGRYLKKKSNGTWQCRQRKIAWFRAKELKPVN
jgi:hypothetical protein